MTEYEREAQANNKRVADMFQQMFPGLDMPYEYVYELLQYLSETKVNAQILPRVIRGVNNIVMGTGKGQVIVHVQKEIMNVSIRETDDELQVKV